MNWLDALHYAIEDAKISDGGQGDPEIAEALGQIRDFLQDNPEAWEGERNKVAGPRWKVGDKFQNPPGHQYEYTFTVTAVDFMPHYGEWTYSIRDDVTGEENSLGAEDLEWNVQIG